MHQLPRTIAGRVQLAAAVVLVLLAFAGSAAVRVHGAVASTELTVDGTDDTDDTVAPTDDTVAPTEVAVASTDAERLREAPVEAPATADETFTLGDLAAGRVPQDVQDRFWQAQLDAIRTAPCPEGVGAGATTLTIHLGADEAWTQRLQAATEAHAAACAA